VLQRTERLRDCCSANTSAEHNKLLRFRPSNIEKAAAKEGDSMCCLRRSLQMNRFQLELVFGP